MLCFDHPVIVLVVAVLSWPIYKAFAKVLFGDKYRRMGDSLHYYLQSDFVSMLRGDQHEDRLGTFLLMAFFWSCLLWVIAVAEGFCRLIWVPLVS
jgi:hypothetical protein